MSAIDTLVQINISQNTQAVQQASFSIPLIIGPTNAGWSDFVHTYTSPAGMLTDGFTTSSPEYVYALEMFEQALSPTEFQVGHRSAAVAQIDTIAVNSLTGVPGHVYSFKLNGTVISYTSLGGNVQQDILNGLNSAISVAFPTSPPVTGVETGSGGGALLTLTSTVPGQAVVYTNVDSELTQVNLTPNHGIQDDLNSIISESNIWYGMVGCQFTDADILQAAKLIETLKKIYIAISDTSSIPTSSITDIGSVLRGLSLKRTGLIYTAVANISEGKDAAWVGGQLPAVPGSNNWAYKTLVGTTPDALTDNQRSILIGDPVAAVPGKNVNCYTTIGGVNITQMGTMAGGQFIDITIGIDWLQSTLQTNLFAALAQSSKIPYTDPGTNILMSAVKSAIDQGVVNGLIDGLSPITITAPPVLSVPTSQRANRIAPTISFSCRLAGAFNAVVVSGTVTV